MRKILIPTDLSSNALRATQYAAELFKHGPTQLFLLHAYADDVYDAKQQRADSVFDELKEELALKTESALEMLKKELFIFSPNPKHSVVCKAEFSMLVDAVNDVVEQENIDVVVMGTKGKTDNKKMTFGSNTLQVIKYVKCPVLAVPEECALEFPKNILLCTDFLLPYKKREIKLLSDLAKRFGARIHLLYESKFPNLSLRQQDNKAFLEAMFQENQVKYHCVQEEDLTTAINSAIKTHHIDLLAMINTRHSYLENILYQSTIEKIGLNIKIPFLVFQNLPR